MADVGTTMLVLAGALSALAALASAFAAFKARATASSMLRLEEQRRRDELEPSFEFKLDPPESSSVRFLHVRWVGGGVNGMRVNLRVLDEEGQDHRSAGPPSGVAPSEWDDFVWGPLEFDLGASAQATDRRTTKPREYSRLSGETWDRLQLKQTRPGSWMVGMSEEAWASARGPLRLAIICESEEHPPPWTQVREISTT